MTTKQMFGADWKTSQAVKAELIEVKDTGIVWELKDYNNNLDGWYGKNFNKVKGGEKKWPKKRKMLKK